MRVKLRLFKICGRPPSLVVGIKVSFTSVDFIFVLAFLVSSSERAGSLGRVVCCGNKKCMKVHLLSGGTALNKISDEAGQPPEFKHIIKGRKRN
jgi:hypothetical protein